MSLVFKYKKMEDIKKILEENLKLKKEIEILTSKLKVIKIWVQKEVRAQTHKIARSKTSKLSQEVKEDFFSENIEEVIAKRINDFFGDLMLLNAPKGTIELITSAEINYYNMIKNPTIDWFAVISNYHKVLDLFIETLITNNFRKFAKKKWCTVLRVNDPLEKSLNLIVNSKYILSVWRLYALLKMIKNNEKLYDYSICFKDYLYKYPEIRDVLLDNNFFNKFTTLNKTEVLSTKRHSWTITKKETIQARKILIWDFKDNNSIIYKILESWTITI